MENYISKFTPTHYFSAEDGSTVAVCLLRNKVSKEITVLCAECTRDDFEVVGKITQRPLKCKRINDGAMFFRYRGRRVYVSWLIPLKSKVDKN